MPNHTSGWQIHVLRTVWTLLDKWYGHQFVQFLIDIFACIAGALFGWIIGTMVLGIGEPLAKYFPSIAVLCFGVVGSFYALHGYKPSFLRRQERELEIIVKSATVSLLLSFAVNFVIFKSAGFSRYIYLFDYVLILGFLLVGRFGLKRLYKKLWRNGIGRAKALIIGGGLESFKSLEELFRIQQFSRFQLVGSVQRAKGQLIYSGRDGEVPLDQSLDQLLDREDISTVFVALQAHSGEDHQLFLHILSCCEKNNRQIFSLSSIFRSNLYEYDQDEYVGVLAIRRSQPALAKKIPSLIKRLIDISMAVFLGVVLSPLLIFIALAVKVQDGGRVFHRRRVVGLHGKPFDAFKFRTMVENADEVLENNAHLKKEFVRNFKLGNDPRITRLGAMIRKGSLDELPQLFNVLRGEMTLIGPRMVTPEELERYGKFKEERIKVRPGISGYWQISGRQDVDYEERILMDRFYIYRWNIWMDLWIILKTVQKVLKMEGAI